MRILVDGTSMLICRAASMPLTRGMRTSMSTTSGASSCAFAMASSPFSASATTSMFSSVPSTTYSPRRNRAWSSAMRTRMTSEPDPPASVNRSGWLSFKGFSVGVCGMGPSGPLLASGRVDQPDESVMTPVHHTSRPRVGVGKEEELMAQQVHLQDGFLRCHRLHGELLDLDDSVACRSVGLAVDLVVVHLIGRSRHFATVRGEVYRSMPPDMGTHASLPLCLLQPVLELVDDQVDRAERVGRRGVGPDGPAVAVHGHLADLLGRDPRVALGREVDLRPFEIGRASCR